MTKETLSQIREDAQRCTDCPLYKHATQTVFGEGPARAGIVLVGEQPGDQEDLTGKPFVGPAGQILDRALKDAQIERAKTYVTNAVKHFKFAPRASAASIPGPTRPRSRSATNGSHASFPRSNPIWSSRWARRRRNR